MAIRNVSSSSLLGKLAGSVGATEPALRLLVSILLGYPLGLIHRYTLFGKKPEYQHLFFVISGLAIGYFNYGWEVLHSVATVVGVYVILFFSGGTLLSVILVLAYAMFYLLIGYYTTGTETYDIKWSMPQCVLTLRLIGLAFDIYDGRKPADKLSNDMKKTAIDFTPTFLEVAAHTYFPASFLVGPQFPIKRYLEFVAGKYGNTDPNAESVLPNCLLPGFKRGALGFFYLGIYQVGTSYFPDVYLLSPDYDALPFYKRCFFLGLWGKITLYKYISCWLISEGVCIITGLTYNGVNEKNVAKWDGCANVKLRVYENATKFGHFILSFNINTNYWVAQYVYKRLRFLGNRFVSQAAALLFLAIWHGLHSGYYICFFMEFIIMYFEKDLESIIAKSPAATKFFTQPLLQPIKWFLLKIYTFVFMGYCLLPFALLSYHRWFQVYKSVYFIGHIFFMGWPLVGYLVRMVLKPERSQKVPVPSKDVNVPTSPSKTTTNITHQHSE